LLFSLPLPPFLPPLSIFIMPDVTRFDKLTDGNYFEWKIYMEALLTKKGLLGIVKGTDGHPGGNATAKRLRDFARKQQEARAEIVLNVTPAQLAYCRDTDPKVIWDNLITVHTSRGRSTTIALRRRFHRLRFDRSETMPAYIARVRHVAFLLQEADVTVSDDDLILAITSGLPHSYDSFLISLDAAPDREFTLSNVTARLVNEYQRQHMYTVSPHLSSPAQTVDEALAVTSVTLGTRLARITCFKCGEKGHYQSNCPTHVAASPAPKTKEFAGQAIAESDSDVEDEF